jgi:hypothetical protein
MVLALDYAFSVFLFSHIATVSAIAASAATILIVIHVAKKYFPEYEPPRFFQEALKTIIVVALTLKLQIYIHEYGHMLAALLCFKDTNPIVEAGFLSGSTTFNMSNGLTSFGQLLEIKNVILFTSAAGLMAETITSIAQFAIVLLLKGDYPKISELINHVSNRDYKQISAVMSDGLQAFAREYLTIHAITQCARMTLYCVFEPDSLGHDFYNIWKVGNIHPLVTLAVLIVIPLTQLFIKEYKDSKAPSYQTV